MKFTLNAVQSKAVQELSEAVDNVLEANILEPLDFAAARGNMKLKIEQLELAFPDLVKPAAKYNFDDSQDVPEWISESEDHSEAAFNALVSTQMLDQAESLSRFTRLLDVLSGELDDIASFSENYDVNYGVWK